MIKIYLLDFSGAEAENFPTSALPSFVRETKNDRQRRDRLFSYLLLSYAYSENFREPMPPIEKDEYGRPHFVSGNVDFNISHSGSLASVIISDEGRVGIDIQNTSAKVSERLTEKVAKALVEIPKAEQKKESIFLRAADGKLLPAAPFFKRGSDIPFFRKWTEQEALCKADGRGLSYFSKIFAEDFILISEDLFDIDGDVYAFAAVKEK